MVLDLVLLTLLGGGVVGLLLGPMEKGLTRNALIGLLSLGELGVGVHLAMNVQAAPSRDEVPQIFAMIQAAEIAFHEPFDEYLPLPACPEGVPSAEPREMSRECLKEWSDLGIRPERPLLCTWQVKVSEGVRITAQCDVDGDGDVARFEGDLTQYKALSPEGVR
ncbi:MAG: hypothetical protein JXX28_12290 [Deltaproteobacteria bacterium]|nr:hypothetical protein [Deltaproteobacteria bacterium]